MSRLMTRISTWPLVSVREEGASITFFEGDAPEELSTIWVGPSFGIIPDEAVSAAEAWRERWADEMLDHLAGHFTREEVGGCDVCDNVVAGLRHHNPDSKPLPLPPIHADTPSIAVWCRGRRVSAITEYYEVVNPSTSQVERWCYVEALSVTGEQLCTSARLDEVTFSAYRRMEMAK